MRYFLYLILFGLLVSGCSSKKDDETKERKLVKFEKTVKLKKQWSTDTGSGQDKRYTKFLPAIDADRVFVAGHKGDVVSLNKKNGKRLWKAKLDVSVSAAGHASNGKVFLGTYDGEVIALKQEDGSVSWKAKVSTEVLAPPVSNGDIVVVHAIDGQLFAFDHNSGEKLWSYDHPVPLLTLRGVAMPIVTDSQVIAAFGNGQIIALSASDGSTSWEVRVAKPKGKTELERIVDVDANPILVGGLVYAASYQGAVVAVSRSQGKMYWLEETSTASGIAVGNGRVVVSSDISKITAYNASNGSVVWENAELLYRQTGGAAVLGDYVAVVDDDDYLHLLSLSDGSFAFRFKPSGDDFRSPPIVEDDVLYLLADNGRLSTYTLKPLKK